MSVWSLSLSVHRCCVVRATSYVCLSVGRSMLFLREIWCDICLNHETPDCGCYSLKMFVVHWYNTTVPMPMPITNPIHVPMGMMYFFYPPDVDVAVVVYEFTHLLGMLRSVSMCVVYLRLVKKPWLVVIMPLSLIWVTSVSYFWKVLMPRKQPIGYLTATLIVMLKSKFPFFDEKGKKIFKFS